MRQAAFVDAGCTDIAGFNLLVGGEYQDGSRTVMSLLKMSGNFLDYTQEQPVTQ